MQALARGHMQAHRPAAGGASRASAARVPALPHQPRRLVVANSFRQGSTSITKKRYKFGQGNGLPPVRGGVRFGAAACAFRRAPPYACAPRRGAPPCRAIPSKCCDCVARM